MNVILCNWGGPLLCRDPKIVLLTSQDDLHGRQTPYTGNPGMVGTVKVLPGGLPCHGDTLGPPGTVPGFLDTRYPAMGTSIP